MTHNESNAVGSQAKMLHLSFCMSSFVKIMEKATSLLVQLCDDTQGGISSVCKFIKKIGSPAIMFRKDKRTQHGHHMWKKIITTALCETVWILYHVIQHVLWGWLKKILNTSKVVLLLL